MMRRQLCDCSQKTVTDEKNNYCGSQVNQNGTARIGKLRIIRAFGDEINEGL